jgi:hypothetical protein
MSETVDLTLLSGSLQGMEREVRLLRLQLDHLAGTVPVRLGGIEARLGVMEQSVHDLAAEVARGFGQVQQQLTRHEKRFDALDAGLAALPEKLTEHMERIMRAIVGAGGPGQLEP